MKELAMKSACGDKSAVSITAAFNMNTRYCLFLSNVLGSISTDESSYVILGMDFVYNIATALRIIWLRKKRPEQHGIIDLLQELVIVELVEFMVPLTYLLCFVAAYYGPNSELIGGMKNSYWQYKAIEDVDRAIKNISLFFFIDFLSGIVCCAIIWVSCRISLLKVYIALLKEFGTYFLVTFVYVLSTVSNKIPSRLIITNIIILIFFLSIKLAIYFCLFIQYTAINSISNAIDLTFRFQWIRDPFNETLNSNN
jgi:hypothetical protein